MDLHLDKHAPVFYGKVSLLEKLTLGLMMTRLLKNDLAVAPPNFLLNLGMLLIMSAMKRMKTDQPDQIMADISDCAVRSLSNMQAWMRENGEET